MSTKQRFACLHDLNNYFKKKDLLSGLTELEQARLRLNIGILDPSTDDSLISRVTYATFNDMRVKQILTPGKKYVITDYQTIYSSNVIVNRVPVSWGTDNSDNPSQVYELLVTAISTSEIDRNVIALNKDRNWEITYDPELKVLADGVTTKGTILSLKDSNNNKCFYDFKNVKSRFYKSELKNLITSAHIDLYTFSEISNNTAIDSSNYDSVRNNAIQEGSFENVFIGDAYNNVIYSDCSDNLFMKGAHDNIFTWNTVNNKFEEEVCYLNGSMANKTILAGNIELASSITKTIHKVNEATIVSYLDPITYSYQIIKL